MRTVKVEANQRQGKHFISFGHKRYDFANRKDCVFVATDLSKKLTSSMLDLNRLLSQTFIHVRKVWSLDETMNKANLNSIEQIQYTLDLSTGTNTIHNVKHLKIACSDLNDVLQKCFFFYRTRNHTTELKEVEFLIKNVRLLHHEIDVLSPFECSTKILVQESSIAQK